MVQIAGKYEHVSNDGYPEYLQAMGASPDSIKQMSDSKPVFEISESGGKWTIKVSDGGKGVSSTFALGEPYDDQMPNGVLKSITKRHGDKLITETDFPEGKKVTRTYEFTDNGLIMHLSENKTQKKATRTYKRI